MIKRSHEMHNYSAECNHFLFRRSWVPVFRTMTDAQAGILIKAICSYVSGVDESPEEPIVKVAYEVLTVQLNSSCKRHLDYLRQKEMDQ